MIQDNIARILGQIKAVCARIGRDPSEIVLVGVTKYAGIVQINEAIKGGLRHVGENKVQEARKKFDCLNDQQVLVTRHMIGHLQTNKVKQALELFDLIHSVDSLKLAAAIEDHASKSHQEINILVQVNTSGEAQKFGISPAEADSLIKAVSHFKHLHLQGLMAIAPSEQGGDVIRRSFRDLRLLCERFKAEYAGAENISMKYLSMGMTDDFEIALEEGSNMVRIGRAIFNDQ